MNMDEKKHKLKMKRCTFAHHFDRFHSFCFTSLLQVEVMSMWAFDKFKYTEDSDVQVLGFLYQSFPVYIFTTAKFALGTAMHEFTIPRMITSSTAK